MANGFFLGGFAEGAATADKLELEARKTALAEKTAADDIALRKKGQGLEGLALSLRQKELEYQHGQDVIQSAQRDRGLDLQSRGLDIQAKREANEADRERMVRTDKSLEDLMTTASGAIKAARDAWQSPDVIAERVKPLLEDMKIIASKSGRDPKTFEVQIQALISAPTLAERSKAEGAGIADKKKAEAEALIAAGVEPSSAQETAGIKLGGSLDLRTFKVNGKMISVRADDKKSIDAIIEAGGVATPVSVQATDISGLDMTMGPDKKAVFAAREKVRESQFNIEELAGAQEAFRANPAAVGVSGFLIENLVSLAKQAPLVGRRIGAIAERSLGYDPKAVTDARTKARLGVGQMLR
ncbi:MAG: hypothetical protein ACRD2L_03610, partial [Terriglobia bacterium]